MPSTSSFFASVLGRLVMIAAVASLIIFGVTQCQSARVAGKKAAISADQTAALGASAADAIGAIGDVSSAGAASDALTMENADAISSAKGADAPVDRAVRAAGRDSLCGRAAYRNSQQCLQFTPAGSVAQPGAGGAVPAR